MWTGLKLLMWSQLFPPDNWVSNSNTYDRLRSISTPQIGILCHHYLNSLSDLRVFSDLWPIYFYQINVFFRVKICIYFYLVTWWMWVKFVHHLNCILYQMNAKRSKFQLASINSVRLTRILSNKKVHQWPSYLNKFESKI